MSEEQTQHEHSGGVNIQSRINFVYAPALIIFAPLSLISLIVFSVFAFTHWVQFVAMTGTIISWVLFFFGMGAVITLTWCATKALRALVEVMVMLGHGGASVYRSFSEARGQRMRNKVIVTHDNYVVYERHGQIEVKPVAQEKIVTNYRQQLSAPQEEETEDDDESPVQSDLPRLVYYDAIRHLIPAGHTLIGALSPTRIETRDSGVRACLWIVGGSGTGKTTTCSIRVHESSEWGYMFVGVDPHAYKEDSLTNAIKPYASRFLLPIAQDEEDIDDVLDFFLDHFYRRRDRGEKWTIRICILIDEMGALTASPETDKEIARARKIKEIVRICGQEARNFGMSGIFMSQDAAGLAWLRKRATLVFAHQLAQMSERKIACNENVTIAREMDNWPKGRTYVYGIDFTPIVVQQPLFIPTLPGRYPNNTQQRDQEEEPTRFERGQSSKRHQDSVDAHYRVIEDSSPSGYLHEAFHAKASNQRLQGDLLTVYQAIRRCGTTNNKVLVNATGFSAGKVSQLFNDLKKGGYIW
jgi:hypothetical protein